VNLDGKTHVPHWYDRSDSDLVFACPHSGQHSECCAVLLGIQVLYYMLSRSLGSCCLYVPANSLGRQLGYYNTTAIGLWVRNLLQVKGSSRRTSVVFPHSLLLIITSPMYAQWPTFTVATSQEQLAAWCIVYLYLVLSGSLSRRLFLFLNINHPINYCLSKQFISIRKYHYFQND
jgi:hypothetical protein